MTNKTPSAPDKRAKNEIIKENSNQLRGTLAAGIVDVATGAISDDDNLLLKFHGSYMQDDRDLRAERAKKKLEKAYSFMIRVRVPGGLATSAQWIAMDDIASTYANKTLRLTTRQAFQFHGVIKTNLKTTMAAINASLLDTLAACGDVNRNVMSAANPYLSLAHMKAYELARDLSAHLSPQTGAYHEIWLDGEPVADSATDKQIADSATNKPVADSATDKQVKDMSHPAGPAEEPIYGQHYLPRKFKTVVAVPPWNDVDIYAHDLGYIAILGTQGAEKGKLVGYNVTVGGGMGMTHGETDTFPRTADVLGFCTPEQAINVGEKVVTTQRDWGNREVRKHARLKYTIEKHGIVAFRTEVEQRIGHKLGAARPFTFSSTGDPIGWQQGADKLWHLTLFIENGRIKDVPGHTMRKAFREIAETHKDCPWILTSNQNVIIASVSTTAKSDIEAILSKHGVSITASSGLRRNSMACVSLPTCALGLAESERYLPKLTDKLEDVLDQAGLRTDDIMMRMTGCPNGCARPYLAEIGFVGRGPGLYNLYLGAAFDGSRLSKLYAQDVDETKILKLLTPLLLRYAKERNAGPSGVERFGDFVIRIGVVKATPAGNRFHADIALA
jgi:sulfite reductase (NADPH) hemoprotein beta-component